MLITTLYDTRTKHRHNVTNVTATDTFQNKLNLVTFTIVYYLFTFPFPIKESKRSYARILLPTVEWRAAARFAAGRHFIYMHWKFQLRRAAEDFVLKNLYIILLVAIFII